jgi:hypothetical protein
MRSQSNASSLSFVDGALSHASCRGDDHQEGCEQASILPLRMTWMIKHAKKDTKKYIFQFLLLLLHLITELHLSGGSV